MSYQQLTPELTQKIINEAVNSNLSSYQIAFKYSITNMAPTRSDLNHRQNCKRVLERRSIQTA